MTSWGDEIDACMYAGIMEVHQVSLNLQLLCQVSLKLGIEIVHDGTAAILLVDLVSIPCRADHRKAKLDITFLQF